MSREEFNQVALPWMQKGVQRQDIDFVTLAETLHTRCEVLGDVPAQLDFIDSLPDYALALYTSKKMKTDPAVALDSLKKIKPVLENLPDFKQQTIHDALFAEIERLGCKNGVILWPLRVAVTGKQFTPGGGIELAAVLGRKETLARVDAAIARLQSL
jgi:glutamyl-tRNA synthetase